jgi:hypothetical protein
MESFDPLCKQTDTIYLFTHMSKLLLLALSKASASLIQDKAVYYVSRSLPFTEPNVKHRQEIIIMIIKRNERMCVRKRGIVNKHPINKVK